MVSGSIRKWPAHVIDGLTFAIALINHLCTFALLILALYGAFIILALHAGPVPTSEDMVSATPLLLKIAACITLLAWMVGFVILGRSPFGRFLPNRWASQLLKQPAVAKVAKHWSANTALNINPRSHWSLQANQLLQALAEASQGDHPRLDGHVDHMHHWLKMREHALAQCSRRELGAIMHEANAQRNGQSCH